MMFRASDVVREEIKKLKAMWATYSLDRIALSVYGTAERVSVLVLIPVLSYHTKYDAQYSV